MEWTPALAVGDERIDQQHAELIKRFNRLQSACQERRGKEEIRELFDFLDHYMMVHFTDEERLMLNCHYPQIMTHQQEHLELITKLRKLKRQMHDYDISAALVIDMTQILYQWIITHIRETDVRLGAYLREQEDAATTSA